MLVLSRKIGEELHIGNDTVVVVQAICGNRVRLGIQAARETRVLRGELAPFETESAAGHAEKRLRRIAR